MIHNPILLPEDIKKLAEIVKRKKLNENTKPGHRKKIGQRIRLFQEIISIGIHKKYNETK